MYRLTLNMTATASSSTQGLSPDHISSTTQPALQMSTLVSYLCPGCLTTSGAIQKIDPCMVVEDSAAPSGPTSSVVLRESAKPESLHRPDASIRMWLDLIFWKPHEKEHSSESIAVLTRCMIPLEWRYFKPLKICELNDFVMSSPNLP